jgi:hypothetical protein
MTCFKAMPPNVLAVPIILCPHACLKANGFEIETDIVGHATGFIARYESNKDRFQTIDQCS